MKPGLNTEQDGANRVSDRHHSSKDESETAKHFQLRFGIESPRGGVYEGRYRKLHPYQRDNDEEGGHVEQMHVEGSY